MTNGISKALWAKLEAERLDLSYRQKPANTKPAHVCPKPAKALDKKAQEQRDKIMFNAGRYAAGARDKTATQAHTKFESLLNN